MKDKKKTGEKVTKGSAESPKAEERTKRMEIYPKTTELGLTYNNQELSNHFKAVLGGVSWPAKREGFAVVVGHGRNRHFDSNDIYLLDEYESSDMRDLVRQCIALDLKYQITLSKTYCPGMTNIWIGCLNDAADEFIQETNAEREKSREHPVQNYFSLNPTPLMEMENLYSFIIPQLKDMLTKEHRTLFLKDSKIINYLSEIKSDEIAELKLGDYPAIEALGFAVIELLQMARGAKLRRPSRQKPWADNVLTRGLKIRK